MASHTFTLGASTTVPTNVLTLIRTVSGHALDDGACALLTIRANDANTSYLVYVGDSSVTSTNYGIALSAGDSRTWNTGIPTNDVSLRDKYCLSSTTETTKINVDWSYA